RHRHAGSFSRSAVARLARRSPLQEPARQTRFARSVMSEKPSFFSELKRRNVYKVAVAYAVVSWLLIRIATQVFPCCEIPNWAVRLVILLLILEFQTALILPWAFEITPEGIKRESEFAPDASIIKRPGRRIVGLTIIVAIIAASLLVFQLVGRDHSSPAA